MINKKSLLISPEQYRVNELRALYSPHVLTTEMSEEFLAGRPDITKEEKCWLRSSRLLILEVNNRAVSVICSFMNITWIPKSRPYDAYSFHEGFIKKQYYEIKIENAGGYLKSKRLSGKAAASYATWKTHDRIERDKIIYVIAGFFEFELLYLFTINSDDYQSISGKKLLSKIPKRKKSVNGATINLSFNEYYKKPSFSVYWLNPLIERFKSHLSETMGQELIKLNNIKTYKLLNYPKEV